ncbi:MAG: ATP-binding protein, partial [Actinomycetota bacterium]
MTARRPKETPTVALERRYPATPEAVGIARGSLDDLVAHFQPTCLDNLKLLLSEVVTNAIRHGPQGDDASIVMRVVVRDETVRAEVADGGPGFAPPRGPAADGSSGWGLYL